MAQKLYEEDYVKQLEQQVKTLAKELDRVNQMMMLLTHKQFGQKKETLIPSNQLSLFDEPSQKKQKKTLGQKMKIKTRSLNVAKKR